MVEYSFESEKEKEVVYNEHVILDDYLLSPTTLPITSPYISSDDSIVSISPFEFLPTPPTSPQPKPLNIDQCIKATPPSINRRPISPPPTIQDHNNVDTQSTKSTEKQKKKNKSPTLKKDPKKGRKTRKSRKRKKSKRISKKHKKKSKSKKTKYAKLKSQYPDIASLGVIGKVTSKHYAKKEKSGATQKKKGKAKANTKTSTTGITNMNNIDFEKFFSIPEILKEYNIDINDLPSDSYTGYHSSSDSDYNDFADYDPELPPSILDFDSDDSEPPQPSPSALEMAYNDNRNKRLMEINKYVRSRMKREKYEGDECIFVDEYGVCLEILSVSEEAYPLDGILKHKKGKSKLSLDNILNFFNVGDKELLKNYYKTLSINYGADFVDHHPLTIYLNPEKVSRELARELDAVTLGRISTMCCWLSMKCARERKWYGLYKNQWKSFQPEN